jgi:tetratricopeptide (TPR) repeat protein
MSLLPECYRWSQRAIVALDEETLGETEEMPAALARVASMLMYGSGDAARAALSRSLAIAEARADVLGQVGMLFRLSVFCNREGEFNIGLEYAKRARAVAATSEEPDATALAQSSLGRALHLAGDYSGARSELEAAFQHWSRVQRTYFGFDDRIPDGLTLARVLWVQGHPAQAADRARETIKDTERSTNPVSLGLALAWVPDIFIWTGDLASAEENADRLLTHAQSHSLGPYLHVAHGHKGTLAIRGGNAKSGVETLQNCLKHLHALHYEVRNTELKIVLTQGLLAIGQVDDAIRLIDDTVSKIEENGDFFFMPEALRVKGCALLAMPKPRVDDPEVWLMRSLELSRRQGARGWELRSAIDLARVRANRGEPEDGRALLQAIFQEFVEGRDTADLQTAERVLVELSPDR